MNVKCIRCKGSNPNNCGRTFCPIIAKSDAMFKVEKSLNKDFQGSSPSPFVGRFGYPNVNIGILSPPEIKENAWEYDAPRYWAGHDYNIQQIIDFRSELINSNQKANIRDKGKILEIAQEIGMASKPVDIEVNLKDKPKFRLNTDSYLAPQGPNAKLKKASITSNPKIEYKVDKVVTDTDLKANDALVYLYKHDFDENFLSKLLSVGTLGVKKNRKLVPTRWSISAADDILGKNIINEIKKYPESDFLIYFGSYLGNYFLIMFFPDVWSYELFETYMPNASWNINREVNYTTDYEAYDGRKDYASNTAGGYYANRLPILERLSQLKRQSSVLSLRFITGEYAAPLGVWVVREASRKALGNKPLEFSSKELMLSYVRGLVKRKFNFDLDRLLRESILLKNMKQQTKLTTFLI